MNKFFQPKYPLLFGASVIFLVELLSFTAYFLPVWQPYLLAASFLAALLLSLRSLEYGLTAVAMELVIGSKGHLFSFEILGFPLSLRFALWAGLMLATLIYLSRKGLRRSFDVIRERIPQPKVFLAFVAMVAIGIIIGFLNGNRVGLILADANAWLYLSLFIPALLVYDGSQDKARRLSAFAMVALAWLCLKTLILLFIFSHNLQIMPDIYLWLRRSGVGEITAMGGGWQRIFIQSQIYAPIAYIFLLWHLIASKKNMAYILTALSCLMAVIIISMSRSIWLAFVLSGLALAVYSFKNDFKAYLRVVIYGLISLVGAAILMFSIVRFPYPNPSQGLSAEALAQRLELTNSEAAVASRWSQLPELKAAILESSIIGRGFGTTVTYRSQDPKVLALNPDGRYTTYAFEWAYLDIWLKIGLLGLGLYLVWLFLLAKSWLKGNEARPMRLAVAGSILFLAIVNIFTPYLNHPLGLGFIILSTCFFRRKPL